MFLKTLLVLFNKGSKKNPLNEGIDTKAIKQIWLAEQLKKSYNKVQISYTKLRIVKIEYEKSLLEQKGTKV